MAIAISAGPSMLPFLGVPTTPILGINDAAGKSFLVVSTKKWTKVKQILS